MKLKTLSVCLALFSLMLLYYLQLKFNLKDIPRIPQKEASIVDWERLCPTNSIITVKEGGRLGNCVWEYISTLGLGNALGLRPYVPKGILICLGKLFKNLTIPAYEDTLLSEECRKFHGGDVRICKSKSLPRNSNAWDRLCHTVKHGNAISPSIVKKTIREIQKLHRSGKMPETLILPPWRDLPHVFDAVGIERFQKELQIRDDVKQLAEETLRGVKMKAGNGNLIFVGLHVRRTDYKRHLKILYGDKVSSADVDYYSRAMSRMHELYNDSRMVFVVLSDDYAWCKSNLVNETEGVFWGGLEHSAFIPNWKQLKDMFVPHDLAVLSMQNHSIMGYGTFAVTGSLLSGGHTIVCNISRSQNVKDSFAANLSKKIPNWEQL